jgi:hypothetical protein
MGDLTMGQLLVKLYRGDTDVEHFACGAWRRVVPGDRSYSFLQKTQKQLTIEEMAKFGHLFRVRSLYT